MARIDARGDVEAFRVRKARWGICEEYAVTRRGRVLYREHGAVSWLPWQLEFSSRARTASAEQMRRLAWWLSRGWVQVQPEEDES